MKKVNLNTLLLVLGVTAVSSSVAKAESWFHRYCPSKIECNKYGEEKGRRIQVNECKGSTNGNSEMRWRGTIEHFPMDINAITFTNLTPTKGESDGTFMYCIYNLRDTGRANNEVVLKHRM